MENSDLRHSNAALCMYIFQSEILELVAFSVELVIVSRKQLHFIVAHLHAHSSIQRQKETEFLKFSILQPIVRLDPNAKIIVLGDFNTLSSFDSR